MNFSENTELAVTFLRQAIPTMMKHKIIPNPINYTLWYTYYSNTNLALNAQLDHTISRFQTCPNEVSEALFVEHIGQANSKEAQANEVFQRALTTTVSNLSDTINATSEQTHEFSNALKTDILALGKHDLDEELSPLLDSLNSNANALRDVNISFNDKLDAANNEIEKLKQDLEKSRQEATTDPLTGLSNRRVLESIYQDFISNKHHNEDLSIIIMDIDKFKVFNDTHGHLLGDQILKFVGSLLSEECKQSAKPVRFGGEEFAIVCPKIDIEDSKKIAEKIRAKLSSTPFTNRKTGEKIPPITASFGVAKLIEDEDLASIIERADKALYAAKEGGRNQVQVIH
jgi:diguanylate cyclase